MLSAAFKIEKAVLMMCFFRFLSLAPFESRTDSKDAGIAELMKEKIRGKLTTYF